LLFCVPTLRVVGEQKEAVASAQLLC